MNRRDRTILRKICHEVDVLQGITAGKTLDGFLVDETCKRASCMTLINIGELVKNLSEETREAHRDIPWRQIAGLRDIAAHRYHALEMGDIWTTIQEHIPVFHDQLTEICEAMDRLEDDRT